MLAADSASTIVAAIVIRNSHERAYSGEVDRLFRRNVTGDSAESAL